MYGLDSRAQRRRRWQSTALAPLLVVTLLNGEASAQQHLDPNTDVRVDQAPAATTTSISVDQRDAQLGAGWASSRDLAWTTSGDANGFHLLVAKASDGYRWRTAATLSENGFDTDQWIGNACVTSSGKRAVVVYAPRTFTNKEALAARGGFTATVDLETGAVKKLPLRSSLAYFNPGCGNTESAVLTQEGHESLAKTRLYWLEADTGKLGKPIEVAGQLTSAVPTRDGIVGADSGALVRISDSGERRVVAPTTGIVFRLAADADGGVVFMERDHDRAVVKRAAAGKVTKVATGKLTAVNVASGRAGKVFVTGTTDPGATAVPGVFLIAAPTGARLSTEGLLAVTSVRKTRQDDPRLPAEDPLAAQPVNVSAIALKTGKQIELTAAPGQSSRIGPAGDEVVHPTLTGAGDVQRQAADPNNPADFTDRYCSVPRNDPRNQAMQPKPRQVEWAVDQAVRGALTVQRPANWKNLGMPAYTPQGLFPSIPITGGGYVPAQVMLGVAAQESNLWQAARVAVPGVTANPLIGNYYGIDYYNDTEADDWTINWSDADCGYGVTQVTDGMRLAGKEKPGEVALPYNSQRAVALDFAANIAAGLRILQGKWNQTRGAGLVVNNGDPAKIENWFFAIWAYNSGFYPNKNDGQPWGVGWLNNPANPRYPANRNPFLEFTYEDAAHPQDWPYPEKVMGWAGHPIGSIETPGKLVAGYRPAWWNGDATTGPINRQRVKPPVTQFCDASNQCEPGAKHIPNDPDVIGEPAGPCAHKNGAGQYDLKCWYHQANTWKADCNYSCGNELLRFDPGYAYQDDATSYAPNCGLGGLPGGALIIDDLPDGTPSIRPDCGRPWTNAGTFTLSYKADNGGNYPGKVDTHQIGGGFGGHFWFTHTRTSAMENNRLSTTGTWRLNQALNGWSRILVHLPDHGAHTQQARYEINLGNSITKYRYLSQGIERNGWVSLGVYQFAGVPQVRLNSVTNDGQGEEDVAWDAIAFQPLPGKPANIVAALGDSYSSGEGAGNYYRESDNNHGTERWNACRRSPNAWPRKMKLPGSTVSLGTLSDALDVNNELGFVACSGAQTWHLIGDSVPQSWAEPEKYEKGEGQFHEMSQIRSGVLDENTTLVTLSIGGNDNAAFASAMTECAGLDNCSKDSNFLPKYKSLIDQAQSEIATTLRRISVAARHAKIVLISYPEPLSRTVKCTGSWYFDGTEADALAQLTNYMATKDQETVTKLHDQEKINVSFASPIDAFVGHGGCDTPEWIHKIVLGPNGEGDFHNGDKPSPFCLWEVLGGACLSRESFHPNNDGTTGYAQVMQQKLAQIGYRGA